MAAQQLFVAIVTGQNVSNFPAILECGQAGDMVLWLESPLLAKTNWREPAERVLQKAGLTMLPPLAVPAEANAAVWQERLRESVAQCRRQQWRPVLVLNGGHKLMALILWEIWRELRPKLSYNFDRPAALWISESGLEGPCQLIPYSRHRLDLEEVLNLNHYQFHAFPSPVCLWSSYKATNTPDHLPNSEEATSLVEELLAQSPLSQPWQPLLKWLSPGQLRQVMPHPWPQSWRNNVKNFAVSRRQTEQLYKNLHYAAIHILRASHVVGDRELSYYEEVVRLVEKPRLKKWQQQLWNLIPIRFRQRRKSTPPIKSSQKPPAQSGTVDSAQPDLSEELLERVFLKVCEQIYVTAEESRLPKSNPGVATTPGQEFEQAVARRVVKFLENTPAARQVVQSVYSGVKVSRVQEPQTVVAELDVLLVLKNGILIHIECKTGAWDRKDLDARLTNLRRLGSSIAVLAICAPLFTEPESSTLMRAHTTRVQLERIPDIFYLPFTKPGQPRRYTIPDINGEPQTYEVGTFEEVMSRLLQPYMLCP